MALAPGQTLAVFPHRRLIALGQALDELMATHLLTGVHHLRQGGIGSAQAQVVEHASVKQLYVLEHETAGVVELLQTQGAQVDPAQFDAPVLRVVKTCKR